MVRRVLDLVRSFIVEFIPICPWLTINLPLCVLFQQATEEPRNKKPRAALFVPLIDRYIKGVDPESNATLKRERLIGRVLERCSRAEFILLKGPAAVGKTSVMILVDHFCRTNAEYILGGEPRQTPFTFYTWMERDGKPAEDQL